MATSGGSGTDGSIYKGSVEDFDFCCEPCKDDGNFVEASGYCQNCDEYLCIECKKAHCRPKPCRHHVVLDKHQMPVSKQRTSKVTLCTELCKKHPSECLKFFCKKHEVTGCGDCIILEHRTCDVDYISTLADGYTASTEYTSVIQKVEQLQTEVTDKLRHAGLTATKAEETIKKAIADIKQYRKDVDAYFDTAERILMAKCGEIHELNQRESTKISDALTYSGKKLTSIHARLTSNIENTANIYVLAKESLSLLDTLENEMQNIKKGQFQCVKFAENASLTSDRLTEASLGVLQESALPICAIWNRVFKHEADIGVVLHKERCDCYISGIVHFHDNIIVCTDKDNTSVKLVDIHKNSILSAVSLIGAPWDITFISPDTVAVTITTCCKVQFLEVKNDVLSMKNSINVDGKCRGIDCKKDKLVVSYHHPKKVEILDLRGNVLSLIQTVWNNLFECPYYVVFSQDGGSIYVSELVSCSIIKLTLDGTVQASYKDSGLNNLRGMFVCRDGTVLVCSQNFIIFMSDDCELWEMLDLEDFEGYPSGIYCDEDNGKVCCSKNMDAFSKMSSMIQVFTFG